MTALDRAIGWFIAPPDPKPPRTGVAAWPPPAETPPAPPRAEPATAPNGGAPLRPAAWSRGDHVEIAPPQPGARPAAGSRTAELAVAELARRAEPLLVGPGVAPAAPPVAEVGIAPCAVAGAAPVGTAPRAVAGAAPAAGEVPLVPPGPVSGVRAELVSAGVLGRPREVEPVAAALALALRRDTRAKVATVVLIGGAQVESAGRGGPAARRVVARLEGHGLEGRVRGRLVWVRLDPGDPHLLGWVRRVMYVGAPAVLAVAAPRNAAMDEALLAQDLLVLVTEEPEGPLARSAVMGLTGVPIVAAAPLGRGPARALACAGVRATAAARGLMQPERSR